MPKQRPADASQLWFWGRREEAGVRPARPTVRPAPDALRTVVAREFAGFRSLSHLRLVVELFPYRDVKISAAVQDGALCIRLGEAFQAADEATLRAAARIVLHKLTGRRTRPADHAAFNRFSETPAARALLPLHTATPRPRYRTVGRHYSLPRLFDALNRRYFHGALPRPNLGWSPQFVSRLGSYYSETDLILLNARLDDARVPPLLVEYILYHEMLHKKHGYRIVGGRRQYHTRQFRQDERRFDGYEEAQRLCESFARGRRPRSPRRPGA